MVRVGNIILIDGKTKATVTTLFQIGNGRWFVGYKESNGRMGFFLEGDEEFCVIDVGMS